MSSKTKVINKKGPEDYLDSLSKFLTEKRKPQNHYPKPTKSIKDWLKEWDFDKAKIDIYTHQIHKYPAMFIPQLIRKLIIEYSNEDDLVMDIFNGSGTTSVECLLTNRKSIGIELNPLAFQISKVKTTVIDVKKLTAAYESLLNHYFNNRISKPKYFDAIDVWFTDSSKKYLTHLLKCIDKEPDENIKNVFRVSFSDIIRYVSLVRHNGFKLHRDPKKFDLKWEKTSLFELFHKSFCKSYCALIDLKNDTKSSETIIHNRDSTIFHKEFENSIDLIITSPPYGDSSTTVAYGQFSRLSSQWLGFLDKNERGFVRNIDNEMLGGTTKGVNLDDEILERSITLKSTLIAFNYLINNADSEKSKKLTKRAKDVISFYIDLEKTIINASKYLKSEKYFILITGSRVVKEIKLNTDLIIAELGENYGFLLDAILYRKTIPNKRMPKKVSATNVIGEKAPTMSKESIIILRKR